MSVFEELFDDFMDRAKSVADSATRKTGEVVDMGKLRYEIKQTQWDIEKTYAKLGAIVYESKKSSESYDEVIELAISEIDSLCSKLQELELRLRAYKRVVKCHHCGKENDQNFLFCSRCGSNLQTEEVAEPDVVEVEVEVVSSQEEAAPFSQEESAEEE